MGKRRRITNEIIGEIAAIDSLAFTTNKCSDTARKVFTSAENIEFDIWFNKHYYHRERHGDEYGKREGIEPDVVKNLIIAAARHLIFYSIKVRSFSFVNFWASMRNQRIILTLKHQKGLNLNIVAEYHYLVLNRYEVTVITAIRKDDFYFAEGEYQIRINMDGSSTLSRKINGKIKLIDTFTT
ncbi:hypothetical protein [Pedobacter sp. L105]|uniref:hypothetical protein n=1 Tax=Pedobacter sp. L105 TaxID=1641871 RepID=UPI00131AB86C|nr:hypothetical protein [Pedobacter sp. L105]